MEAGEKCICTEDDWYNAFGEKSQALARGMRLVVKDKHRVGGCIFYNFEETPDDQMYLSTGFKPLRTLN